MNWLILTYSIYLVISIVLTMFVGHTLAKNGRVFLVDCFHGNESLADSVNHLLKVGFYLVNLGFVALFLKVSGAVTGPQGVFEELSYKLGVVLVVLGAMHFFNLIVLAKVRNRAISLPPAFRA